LKTLLSFLAATLFAMYAGSSSAQTECDKYNTSYDKTYCFAKLFLESDKELNAVYTELRALIKDPVRSQLTQVQRDWIKYRNASCERNGNIDVDCNYQVNRERTEYLRDRARECRAGTCRDNMIGKKSWN
jgi:uncharacterized protein YecT (DUF1311 family)